MPTPAQPSSFTGDRARDRFLAAYDRTLAALWPAPVDAVQVPTSMGEVHLLRAGPAADGAVVLLSGAGGNALSWYRHVGALRQRRPVLAIDPLGEPGRSTATAPITDGEDVARWLLELLSTLDVRRAHLVGSSFGGWAALLAAQRDDEQRIAALTLVDPAGLARPDARFYRWIVLGGLAALLPRRLRHRAAGPLRNGTLREDELMTLGLAGRGFRRRLPTPPVATDAELRAVRAPVHLLLGADSALHDPATIAERIARVVPNWRVEVVPGTGHALPLEAAELVVARILRATPTGAGAD
ncbi:alpha/beta fold hydrolase [Modestobacter sp. SYSU DS0290]